MLTFLYLLLIPVALAHNISLPRDGGKRFSNYYAGADVGACGSLHQDSEFVVALTTQEWNGGANCNKDIYITYNGISAVAKIVDECMGCPWDGLDFSQSLFGHFVGGVQNNLNVGIIYGDWSYGTGPSNNGGGGEGDSGDNDDTKTTTTKKDPPAPPPTTSTHSTTTTSSTTTTYSSTTTVLTTSRSATHSASSSTQPVSATHSSASATPTPSAPAGPQNLQDFSQAVLNLAGLIMQAPHAT